MCARCERLITSVQEAGAERDPARRGWFNPGSLTDSYLEETCEDDSLDRRA